MYLGLGVLLIWLVTSCEMSMLIPIVDVVFLYFAKMFRKMIP